MFVTSFAGITGPPFGSPPQTASIADFKVEAESSFATGCSKHLTLFSAGTEIFGPGSEARYLYQVEFGAIRICSLLGDGRRTISAFYFAGEVFGFEVGGHHCFRAEAVDSVGLRTLALPVDAATAGALLPIALAGLMQMQKHLLTVGRQTALERIAGFLLDVAARRNQAEVIDLPMLHSDIADYLGLTPETVCRLFKQLRESGVISFTSSRRITVDRVEALRQLIE